MSWSSWRGHVGEPGYKRGQGRLVAFECVAFVVAQVERLLDSCFHGEQLSLTGLVLGISPWKKYRFVEEI